MLSVRSLVEDAESDPPTVAVLLHVEGWFAHGPAGRVLPRSRPAELVRRVVETLVHRRGERVLLTCSADQVAVFQDLFLEDIKSGRIHLRAVPIGIDADEPLERLLAVEAINGSRGLGTVLVPSLTDFPEALLLTGRLTLVVADEAIWQGQPEANSGEPLEPDVAEEVAAALIAKADHVIATSRLTAEHLVARTEVDRRCHAGPPIVRALRDGGSPFEGLRAQDERTATQLAGRRFGVFEAEGCSNNQLDFAIRIFALARLLHPDLHLVCLRGFGQAARLKEAAEAHGIPQQLLIIAMADFQLRGWLLETAAVAWVGADRDGRSAARVVDAVWAGTPVVAVRTGEIEREFGAMARDLALCAPFDLEEATTRLGSALSDPTAFRQRQRAAREMLAREAGPDHLLSVLGESLPPSRDGAEDRDRDGIDRSRATS